MLSLFKCSINSTKGPIINKFQWQSLTAPSPISSKSKIDRSKVPQLKESDLDEHFVKGSGPGGQCVNKSINCCNLKHIPTGLVVKVHHTRSLEKNKQIARELMIERLDALYNGEHSVKNQKKRIALDKLASKEVQKTRLRGLKEEYRKSLEESRADSAVDS